MKRNYQTETDGVISSLGDARPKLLLQCCCGPCSSYVLEYLCKYFVVTVLFYYPNIFPEEEYKKRLFWLKRVPQVETGICEIETCRYDSLSFDEIAAGLEAEPEGGDRCTECFRLRLTQTAKRAAEGGFDYFCTTLTVSPHKDAQRINQIGEQLEKEFGVKWLPSDFKKREGYKRSTALAAEYGLYRQDYCGCRFSLEESKKTREK